MLLLHFCILLLIKSSYFPEELKLTPKISILDTVFNILEPIYQVGSEIKQLGFLPVTIHFVFF